MSRFHLYQAPDGAGYLLDLQSDYLETYATRMVAPVISLDDFQNPATGLNPIVEIEGVRHVVLTHFTSAVPAAILKVHIADLSDQADEFTRALDLLFQGY